MCSSTFTASLGRGKFGSRWHEQVQFLVFRIDPSLSLISLPHGVHLAVFAGKPSARAPWVLNQLAGSRREVPDRPRLLATDELAHLLNLRISDNSGIEPGRQKVTSTLGVPVSQHTLFARGTSDGGKEPAHGLVINGIVHIGLECSLDRALDTLLDP